TILNAIDSGTKVGNISMLWNRDLREQGLDFGHFGADGSKTFGFTFEKTDDFKIGSYVANLFMECGNDGVAIAGALKHGDKKVPEPAMMLGLAGVSGLGLMRRRRQRKG
ncbi:PEP-CTERM sorting domain-containing protein, partial [filamentous cyanobacterium LEGE 11480]